MKFLSILIINIFIINILPAAPPPNAAFDGICIYKQHGFYKNNLATAFFYTTSVSHKHITWIFRYGKPPIKAGSESFFILLPLPGRGQEYPESEIFYAYQNFPHLRKTIERVNEHWMKYFENPTEPYAASSHDRFYLAESRVLPKSDFGGSSTSIAPLPTSLRTPSLRTASLSSGNQIASGDSDSNYSGSQIDVSAQNDFSSSEQFDGISSDFNFDASLSNSSQSDNLDEDFKLNLERILSYFNMLRNFNEDSENP